MSEQQIAASLGDLRSAGMSARPMSRSRKSEQRRRQIIRAATDMINEKSYALATMTEIAASLDLRDATLYYYFPSKPALAYACIDRSLETFERLLDLADEAGGSGAQRLTAFLRGMMEHAERHGAQVYMGDYSYLEPAQRDVVTAWLGRLTNRLEAILGDGISDGSIKPCETELVVQLLVGMLVWLAKWAPSLRGMTTDRLMEAIEALALNGLVVRSPAR